ncbi:type IV pilus assembly protein PilA [Mobilisporobacter senegalensis]|uniref:Type IV pilus assembly protein PilA n=1 Tax=Mobilisporobacter senegalensis TaxID=1329262 RepID=A0A3N1XVL1_9FIRM|nr:type II secretion system protein [Mobilisporobacter senegalensis]ROR30636.1 type IV pilus assembly protein PilA [Mobilisporobacter senegalensis]
MKKEKRLNNKGFSLVELIIVIAIMAVLAGALAPQFIKYVAKSREATDNQNIDLLIATTNAVLADPDVTPAVGTVTITSTSAATFTNVGSTFEAAFKQAVGSKYPMSKVSRGKGFVITIGGSDAAGWTVTCTVAP